MHQLFPLVWPYSDNKETWKETGRGPGGIVAPVICYIIQPQPTLLILTSFVVKTNRKVNYSDIGGNCSNKMTGKPVGGDSDKPLAGLQTSTSITP